VRQEAYYNSIPHKCKITRAEQIERLNNGLEETIEKKSDDDFEEEINAPKVTILERQEIPMPEITSGAEYLVSLLHSAGQAKPTGMGLVGLDWTDIKAWADCCDLWDTVTPRDLQTVFTLSRAYANECTAATQEGAKPPYSPPIEKEQLEEMRDVVSDSIDDIFAGMIAAQPTK
jgi:hypothetical protein